MKKSKFLILCIVFVVSLSNFSAYANDSSTWDNNIGIKDFVYEYSLEGSDIYYMTAIKQDDTLWVWNYLPDRDEQLPSPKKIFDNVIKGNQEYALKNNGELWVWKADSYGTGQYSDPIKIMDDVKEVDGNYKYGYAIKNDSSLWTWNLHLYPDNIWKRYDYFNHNDDDFPKPTKMLDNVKKADYSDLGSGYAIKEDNSLWIWERVTDTKISVPAKILDNVEEVYVGSFSSYAITKDRGLWTWGKNSMMGNDGTMIYGMVGDGTTESRLKPIKILDDVKQAVLDYTYGYAIKNDGSLWFWGNCWDSYEYLSPKKIMNDVKKTALETALSDHNPYPNYIIKTDNSLWEFSEANPSVQKHVADNVKQKSIHYDFNYILKNDNSLWVLDNETNSVVRKLDNIESMYIGSSKNGYLIDTNKKLLTLDGDLVK